MRNTTPFQQFIFGALALLLSVDLIVKTPLPDTDWTEYNGDGGRSHYSPLDQITADNVQQLQVA